LENQDTFNSAIVLSGRFALSYRDVLMVDRSCTFRIETRTIRQDYQSYLETFTGRKLSQKSLPAFPEVLKKSATLSMFPEKVFWWCLPFQK